jgi:TonB family protein
LGIFAGVATLGLLLVGLAVWLQKPAPQDNYVRVSENPPAEAVSGRVVSSEPFVEAQPTPATPNSSEPPQIPIQPLLSPAEIEKLSRDRDYEADLVASANGIINAPSLEVRAQVYCDFTVRQTDKLIPSGNDPHTAVLYQQENVRRCTARVLSGLESMPSDAFFHEKAAKAQRLLDETNLKLSSLATAADTRETPTGVLAQGGAGADSPAALISKVDPMYPRQGVPAGFSGIVHVELSIDQAGNVTEASVIDSPGHGLDQLAVAAGLRWKFRPASKDGHFVPSTVTVTEQFR